MTSIQPGDVIEVEIEGLGKLINPVLQGEPVLYWQDQKKKAEREKNRINRNHWVDLSANENPLGPSPGAKQSVAASKSDTFVP